MKKILMERYKNTQYKSGGKDAKSNKAFNVILISFDTLRRDFLSCYGYSKQLSPSIDKLSGAGVLFNDTVVNSGWTLPQHITMLTGTHPLKHRFQRLKVKVCSLPNPIQRLAEIFKSQGYLTFGFANSNRYGGGWEYGYYRGMHYYTTVFPYNNMMERLGEPFSWVLKMAENKPFFIYIHTNDTHEPFAASEPFGSKWGDTYVNRYEGEVNYVDYYFGSILKEIEKRGVKDNTLIVVTSDHGTEFSEHGFQEKKLNLYEEISRVPLIFSLPCLIPPGGKIDGLCETIDIAPTILDACGLPVPEWMDGKSLLPRIFGKGNPSKYVVAHTLHQMVYYYEHFSIRDNRYKFIRTTPLSRHPVKLPGETGKRFARLNGVAGFMNGCWRELYDLKKDLSEKNIIVSASIVANKMEKKLDEYISSFGYVPRVSKLRDNVKF